MGDCSISSCARVDSGHIQLGDVGQITISGGQAPVTLASSGSGDYSAALNSNGLIFLGGETLKFAAAGNTLPAFSGTVRAPKPLVVTQPAFAVAPWRHPFTDAGAINDAGEQFPRVDRTTPWNFAWTDNSAGSVVVLVSPGNSVEGTYVSCTFDSTGMHGEVPAAVLARLNAGEWGLAVYRWNSQQVTVGNLSVVLGAYTEANAADGDVVPPVLILQ
jgi:hypothetical protein